MHYSFFPSERGLKLETGNLLPTQGKMNPSVAKQVFSLSLRASVLFAAAFPWGESVRMFRVGPFLYCIWLQAVPFSIPWLCPYSLGKCPIFFKLEMPACIVQVYRLLVVSFKAPWQARSKNPVLVSLDSP